MNEDDFPDSHQLSLLRETVHQERSALDRIGIGLRALHNHPLFETLPDEIQRLVRKLHERDREAKTTRGQD